jgi:hypothetical protein
MLNSVIRGGLKTTLERRVKLPEEGSLWSP